MKKWIVLSIILAVLIGVAIAYSMGCFNCPIDGQMGWKIGEQWIGGGKKISVYQCMNGHVWQCAW